MMVELNVILKPLSPIVIGEGMDVRNVRRSRSYIPGSVLRGTLAREMIEEAESNEEMKKLFDELFLSRKAARFGPLYPTKEVSDEVIPAPVTAMACKAYGESHTLADTLLKRIGEGLSARINEMSCAKCDGGRMERWRGFIARTGSKQAALSSIPRRAHVKVGLNRYTETAEEGILYVLEAIEPEVLFQGRLSLEEDLWERLRRSMDRLLWREEEGYRIRIGSARARGYGLAVLSFRPAPVTPIEERLDRMQHALGNPDRLYFTLTAVSPALILDETGSPRMTIPPDLIADWVEPLGEGCLTETEVLTGWSQAWGMPKPLMMAIGAGSVFTFSAPASRREELLALLSRIEREGLGERRAEGLGRFSICDPFHLSGGDEDVER
jgi:CRISPR-associated protein Csx10